MHCAGCASLHRLLFVEVRCSAKLSYEVISRNRYSCICRPPASVRGGGHEAFVRSAERVRNGQPVVSAPTTWTLARGSLSLRSRGDVGRRKDSGHVLETPALPQSHAVPHRTALGKSRSGTWGVGPLKRRGRTIRGDRASPPRRHNRRPGPSAPCT
jgi:hypothetical protein